jgi:hypothetical protein
MADDITERIAGFIRPFQVTRGSHVKLAKDFDPAFKAGIEHKKRELEAEAPDGGAADPFAEEQAA